MVAAEGDADRPIRFEVGHLDLGWHPLYESRGLLCVQCFRLTDIIREGPLQGHAPREGDHQEHQHQRPSHLGSHRESPHRLHIFPLNTNSRSDRQRYRITLELASHGKTPSHLP